MLKEKNEFSIQNDGDGRYTGSVVNIYIVYKTFSKDITSTNVLRNSLFSATKVSNTSTNDPQKLNYSGFGIAFLSGTFKHPDSGKNARNVLIFGANVSEKQSILMLGYGSVKKINNTEIFAKQSYTPNFNSDNSKIVSLSLY